jgi:TetR/AcrR family fatty acid metabolism transcriptional regulator
MVYRTTPKMKERKAARRRRFLDVATRLFGERGYHGTTVPMVVAESGSSTGSFYFYFDNKEDLFARVLEEIGERLSAELNEAIAEKEEPFEQMRAAVERLFVFLARNPVEARVLIVESSGLGGRLSAVQREILASHARSVERAIAGIPDRSPPGDPAVLAHCWVGAVYEAVRYWLELPAKKRRSADEVASQVARFNLRGIGR